MMKILRNNILLIVILGLIGVVALGCYASVLRPFNRTFRGIEFELDDNNYIEKTVYLKGKVLEPLIGHKRFEGDIIYNDINYPCILIFKKNFDSIDVAYDNKLADEIPTSIYIDDSFETIVLIVSKKGIETGDYIWDDISGKVFVSNVLSISEGYEMMKKIVDQ